jgi:hypothetical protein
MKVRLLFLICQLLVIRGYCQLVEDPPDSLMNAYFKPGLPGAVIAIHQHQKTIFKKGYGLGI